MTDYDLPKLPSDEDLGIDGMELPDEGAEPGEGGAPDPDPPTPPDSSSAPAPGSSPPPGGEADVPPRGAPTAASATRPVRRWRGPATLAALVVLGWLSSSDRTLPDPVPAAAPDSVFSSARAMVRMVELARAPHPPGSPEHDRVREYLLAELREMGLAPRVQTATAWIRSGDGLGAATVRNVVARIPGTDPTGAILLTAHYDGRTLSPAAGDDASGVAAILEAVRAARSRAPLRNDLLVLLTDGEELGLLGARAFARDHPWMEDVTVVLSVEMRGGGGPSYMFETGTENGWIVEALRAGDPRPAANSLSYEVYRRLPNDTDFTIFREAGLQGLNFAGIGRAHAYHQAFDTPQNFQEATLQHHGLHVLGMLRELGGRDLSSVNAPDRIFFRLPVLGLVTYGTLWNSVLGVVLLLAAVAVVAGVLKAGGGVGSLVAGLALSVLAAGGAAGAGWLLLRQVSGLHPEYGLLHGSQFHSEGWYVLTVVALAFALVTGLLGLVRRRASLPGLAAGALGLPVLAALFLTFAAPMGAMNLQWPVLAAVVGAGLVIGVAGARPPGLVRWALLLALAPVVPAFLVPLTEGVAEAMTVSLLPVLGALAALAFLLLLPLLDALAEPNRWWAPVAGVVLAGGFLGLGLRQARPSADRPTPSTLAYALDRESGEARWISRAGRGLEWARTVAGALDGEAALAPFLGGGGSLPAGPARVLDLQPPEVSTVSDGFEASEGTATGDSLAADTTTAPGATTPESVAEPEPGLTRIALRSRIGAEQITVRAAPENDGLRWRAVNGRTVGGGGPVTSVTHWGRPEGALLLDLEPPPGADSVRIVVVEHHLRPSELLGEEAFRRPPDLVPAADGISDRALVRTVIALPTRPEAANPDPARTPAEPRTDTLTTPSDTSSAPGSPSP